MKPLINEVETKQLKWYGHFKRLDKGRLPRKCWEAKMEGNKGRGRPRKTWLECINSAGRKRGKNIQEMNVLTADRKKWKAFTEMDPTP